MKAVMNIVMMSLLALLISCSSSKSTLKLGKCPLTVTVKAEAENFDGFANVYINENFIGTTDNKTGVLKISLEKGEYRIAVIAEGFEPWTGKVLLLGEGYKQNVLARLKKSAGS